MKLDGGQSHLKSWMGSLCTLIILIVVIAYSVQKMDVLINKKDVNVLSTIHKLYFDEDYTFCYENGLNLAVAFTAYDDQQEWVLDRRYGELVFQAYTWGEDANGTYFSKNERINSTVCTPK